MKIILYVFTGENIEVNKQSKLTQALERDNCTFRNNINISAPIIYLEFNENIIDIPYNYCYIEGSNKYYFIRNKIRMGKNLWCFELDIDVLYTYRLSIVDNIAFVSRNQNEFKNYLVDENFPFLKDKQINILELTNVINNVVNTEFNVSSIEGNGWNTVLSLSDEMSLSSENIISPITNGKLPDVNVSNTNFSSRYEVITQTANLPEFLKDSAVSSFVKSIIVYPCEIPHSGQQRALSVNGKSSNINSYRLSYTPSYYMCIADFYFNRLYNDFRDYSPFTIYEMYIPFVGYVELNAQDIINKNLALIYQPNFEDGSASVLLYNKTDNYIVYQSTCQLGVSIGINTTNTREIVSAGISNTLNLISGTAISAITGNPIGFISASSRFLGNEVQQFIKGSALISNGISGFFSPMKPYFKITTAKAVKEYDSDYLSLYGRPLNEMRLLGSLSGFTKVLDVHLNNISGATYTEIESIEQLLKSGVIL